MNRPEHSRPIWGAASLRCEALACARGDRLLFSKLDFEVAAGDAVLLTGPNGSGKSSLIRLLAGFLTPAHGRILWNGRNIDHDMDLFRLSMLFAGHADAVKPAMTALEQLVFHARLMGCRKAEAHGLALSALERFGLSGRSSAPGRHLSAGQKRRLNLARLLVVPRQLWLLDEPTTSLDAAGVDALLAVISEHRANGGMVIAATHADLVIPHPKHLRLGPAQAKAAA